MNIRGDRKSRRRSAAALGAFAVAASAVTMTLVAQPASAAERDGKCDKGEFCYYYNSNNKGSISDHTKSVPDLGAKQPSCYEFRGAGNGKGKCVKNNAASVWNRTGKTVWVFYNSGYGGASQKIKPGQKVNLNATLKNDNASHRIGGGGSGSSGYWLPFPCGEKWEAGTRTNHNPQNSVDFNHYPQDQGWKVYASAPGTVSKVANLGNTSYGRYIVIDHGGGKQTLYAHLSAQNVKVGQKVTEKTFIGRVGSTGGSTGPHLHYEQKVNGSAVKAKFKDGNPTYWGKTTLARKTHCP
jgi:hypothetical protein